MKRILEGLEPARVFYWFEELCKIPHGSGNTKEISDFIKAFGENLGLFVRQDRLNNLLLKKPAAAGCENARPVILQGHMDMVCQMDAASSVNPEKDGLKLLVEGDTVRAEGTTLGGDDGIAVAMAMALLESRDLPHPPLEVILTVDEEVGMEGAAGFDAADVEGRTMLNLDSEDEGVFTVSCAGGNRTRCTLPVRREAFSGKNAKLTVGGLCGGHSGVEIHKGRANANVLLARVLRKISESTEMRIFSVEGGTKDNAIPSAAEALVCVEDDAKAASAVDWMRKIFGNEYASTDPDITLLFRPVEEKTSYMDRESSDKTIRMLLTLPNGVQAMSADLEGLVESSLNLGILKTTPDHVEASFCVRSSVESRKDWMVDRIRAVMEFAGGSVSVSGSYPGWQFNRESPLRDLLAEIYREQIGKEPVIEAIHAGVECGLFAGKLPGLDCVSMGPDLKDIHTTAESMSVSSVERTWKLVCELLKRLGRSAE